MRHGGRWLDAGLAALVWAGTFFASSKVSERFFDEGKPSGFKAAARTAGGPPALELSRSEGGEAQAWLRLRLATAVGPSHGYSARLEPSGRTLAVVVPDSTGSWLDLRSPCTRGVAACPPPFAWGSGEVVVLTLPAAVPSSLPVEDWELFLADGSDSLEKDRERGRRRGFLVGVWVLAGAGTLWLAVRTAMRAASPADPDLSPSGVLEMLVAGSGNADTEAGRLAQAALRYRLAGHSFEEAAAKLGIDLHAPQDRARKLALYSAFQNFASRLDLYIEEFRRKRRWFVLAQDIFPDAEQPHDR